MKKNQLVLIFTILTLFTSGCNKVENEKNEKYTLFGQIKGIEDQSVIYLVSDGNLMDSAIVLNEKFYFEGNIIEPIKFELQIKNSNEYTSIWLEPTTINVYAKEGDFKNAQIKGSKTQNESDNFYSLVKNYRSRRDSLTQLSLQKSLNDSLFNLVKIELEIIRSNSLKIETDFIKNNPNSPYSSYLVNFYSTTLGKDRTLDLYNSLTDSVKNSYYGKLTNRYLELSKQLEIGDKYVNFSMNDKNGKVVQISDFEGKLILLDFWASWCGPCIQEFPALKKAYNDYKDYGFEIISISEDKTNERWLKSIVEYKLNWINLRDKATNKSDPYLIYGISGIPDNFLINNEGIIIARNLRGDNLISTIKEQIEMGQ